MTNIKPGVSVAGFFNVVFLNRLSHISVCNFHLYINPCPPLNLIHNAAPFIEEINNARPIPCSG